MIDIDNQSDFSLPLQLITKITDDLTSDDIELLVVHEEEMTQINLQNRGINKATDVLSFPLEQMQMAPLGSIIINIEAVVNVSKTLGHSQEEEFCLLYTHGLLHLLGYNHEVDKGEMREKEKEIIKTNNLPDSLIVRTQG